MIRDQFLKTIQKFRMIEKGETVLIAVSGGADSVALLHLLAELRKPWKLHLTILHVNHKLRGKESDQDEAFVRKLARRFKIPIFVFKVEVRNKAKKEKSSLEEAAREVRYQFFEQMAETKKANKIALAHNQDDQAETVLMRIITGTGLQGLQAIRPKRKLNRTFLIRPLIEIARGDIRKFVKANQICFREDRSNRSLQFLRNRIRLKLIPLIERSFNPQVKKALARLPHLLDVDLSFLEETSAVFYRRLANREQADEVLFPRKSFLQLKPSIQYRLVNRAMRELSGAELDFNHWNLFLELLTTKDKFSLQLPKELFISLSREAVRIYQKRKISRASFSYEFSVGDSVYIPEINSTIVCESLNKRVRVIRKTNKNFDIFDGDTLSFPLTVRNRKPGDRLQPLGQKTSVKLKGFLINRHIPIEERDRLPIVVSDGQVAWVGGVGMGEAFKVSANTKRFVRISLLPGS
ncbi:MAG: tRNA lysidine(34) synthetase TilS [Candidatus Omnitrophica bacterium]|nr:tRNA lysidine(34) synthetase TilS [Candidatus Omnitrophota bacterium]